MQFIEVCLTLKHCFLEPIVNVMLANLNFFLSQGLHQSYEDWLIHQSQVIGTTENMNHLSFLLYPLGWAACFYVSFLSLIHSLQGNLPAPLLILDADQGIEKMLETYEKFTVTSILSKNMSNTYYFVKMSLPSGGFEDNLEVFQSAPSLSFDFFLRMRSVARNPTHRQSPQRSPRN